MGQVYFKTPPIVTFMSPELPGQECTCDNVTKTICPTFVAYVTSGRLREVKNKNKSLKVVAVTYKRWSLTTSSNYSDLTGDILVFWKSGSSRQVVAYERWSQWEVRLYERKAGV